MTQQAEAETPKVKAWSISVLNQYEECPRKTYFAKIAKVVEPKNQHLNRGIELHAMLEACLKDSQKTIPTELQKVERQILELRNLGAIAELELAFDKDWQKCDWFAPNCWARIKIDALVPPVIDGDAQVTIWDWKSGKVSEEHDAYDRQLELYQLAGLLAYPTAEIANAGLIFIDHGVVLEADEVITRDMIPALKKKWEYAVKALLADEVFSPRPSAKSCKWCFYAKAKNGNCEY